MATEKFCLFVFLAFSCVAFVHSNFNKSLIPWAGFGADIPVMKQIYENLTKPAFIYSRPIIDIHKPQVIEVLLYLDHIIELDLISGHILILAYLDIKFKNEHLVWNPEDYDGWDYVVFHPWYFWKPDLCFMNCIESWFSNPFEFKVGVDSTGVIWDINPLVYKFPCAGNVRNFPYDIQKCKIILGSLTGGPDRFMYVPGYGSETHFSTLEWYRESNNTEWILVDFYSELVNVTRLGRKYQEIHFTLVLKRNAEFYYQFLLVPSILLSAIILTVFWIPPARPDRTAVGQGIFGGLMLLLIMVVRISPPSADMKITTYYCVNIVMIVFATIMSSVVVALAQMTKKVPFLMRCILVQGFGRLFGITQQYANVYPIAVTADPVLTTIRDWQVIATVMDRLIFIAYICVSLILIPLTFPFPNNEAIIVPPPPLQGMNITASGSDYDEH